MVFGLCLWSSSAMVDFVGQKYVLCGKGVFTPGRDATGTLQKLQGKSDYKSRGKVVSKARGIWNVARDQMLSSLPLRAFQVLVLLILNTTRIRSLILFHFCNIIPLFTATVSLYHSVYIAQNTIILTVSHRNSSLTTLC